VDRSAAASRLALGELAASPDDEPVAGVPPVEEALYIETALMEQNVLDMVEDAFRDFSLDAESKLSLPEFTAWIQKHPRLVDFVFKSPSVVEHKKLLKLQRANAKQRADMSGWLTGHSRDIFKKYAQRFYVLRGIYLHKYHDQKHQVASETIFMPGAIVRELSQSSTHSSQSNTPTVASPLVRHARQNEGQTPDVARAGGNSSGTKSSKAPSASSSKPASTLASAAAANSEPAAAADPTLSSVKTANFELTESVHEDFKMQHSQPTPEKRHAGRPKSPREKVQSVTGNGASKDSSVPASGVGSPKRAPSHASKATMRTKGSGSLSGSVREIKRTFTASGVKQFGIELSWDNGYSRVLYAEDRESQQAWLTKLREAAHNPVIESKYIISPKVYAQGAFSEIHECTHRVSGKRFAVKVSPKRGLDPIERAGMLSEISILEMVAHPNVISLEAVFEDTENVYIVLELCTGGHLLEFMEGHGAVSESIARAIMAQILEGLEYLHAFGIIHRDLKPKNIMFASPPVVPSTLGTGCADSEAACVQRLTGQVKLVDFGYSKFVRPTDKLNEGVGTFKYWPPEMARGLSQYSKPVDVWSIGVILYRLVTGAFPFVVKAGEDLLQIIATHDYVRVGPQFEALSPQCQDLIERMLTKDPRLRITAEAAKHHPWIQRSLSAPLVDLSDAAESRSGSNLDANRSF